MPRRKNLKPAPVEEPIPEEPEKEPKSENPEDYVDLVADLPECQPAGNALTEYADYPEEKVWEPLPPIDEMCMPLFLFMARSALTSAQESEGIANPQALENSSSGTAEQYISDIYHESSYEPGVALKRLVLNPLPGKLVDRWSTEDIVRFGQGLNKHGKRFEKIRAKFLPHKKTMDLVEFYYKWKRSTEIKGLVASRARRYLRLIKNSDLIIGPKETPTMLTRGKLAADETGETVVDKVQTLRKDESTAVKRKRKSSTQIGNVPIPV